MDFDKESLFKQLLPKVSQWINPDIYGESKGPYPQQKVIPPFKMKPMPQLQKQQGWPILPTMKELRPQPIQRPENWKSISDFLKRYK